MSRSSERKGERRGRESEKKEGEEKKWTLVQAGTARVQMSEGLPARPSDSNQKGPVQGRVQLIQIAMGV